MIEADAVSGYMVTSSPSSAAAASPRRSQAAALRWSATLFVVASWVSAAIFGAYIILFFGGMAARGTMERWNEALPALYDRSLPLAALAIGSHFITGGVLLLLGPIQLIGAIRRSTPALHRWLGRIYVLSASLAGLGGLGFIVSKGTIGGLLMNVGFGLYGCCDGVLLLSAKPCRRGTLHPGSFLRQGSTLRLAAATILLAVSAFVVVATWSFATDYWAPGMVSGITGASLSQ